MYTSLVGGTAPCLARVSRPMRSCIGRWWHAAKRTSGPRSLPFFGTRDSFLGVCSLFASRKTFSARGHPKLRFARSMSLARSRLRLRRCRRCGGSGTPTAEARSGRWLGRWWHAAKRTSGPRSLPFFGTRDSFLWVCSLFASRKTFSARGHPKLRFACSMSLARSRRLAVRRRTVAFDVVALKSWRWPWSVVARGEADFGAPLATIFRNARFLPLGLLALRVPKTFSARGHPKLRFARSMSLASESTLGGAQKDRDEDTATRAMLGVAHVETRRPSASGSGELRVPPSAKRFSARALATRSRGRNLACRKMVASGAPKSTEPRTATAIRHIHPDHRRHHSRRLDDDVAVSSDDDVAVGSDDDVAVGSDDDVAVGSDDRVAVDSRDYLSSANT
jgi:hypothetical protein